VRGDDLPPGVDFAVADFGLNSGPSRAAKYLCRCLGKKQSGTLNNEVIQAAKRADTDDLVNAYCDARAAFLEGIVRSNPSQVKFRKGWLNRVRDVRARSLKLVNVTPLPPKEMKPDVVMPKADPPKPTTKDLSKVSRKARWLQNARRVWNSITWTSILGAVGLANDTSGQVQSFISWPVLVTIITVGVLTVAFIKYIEALLREDAEEGRAIPSGEIVVEAEAV